MVTGWGCSVITPTSGAGLGGAAVFPDEHAASPATQTRQRLVALWRDKRLCIRIVRSFIDLPWAVGYRPLNGSMRANHCAIAGAWRPRPPTGALSLAATARLAV